MSEPITKERRAQFRERARHDFNKGIETEIEPADLHLLLDALDAAEAENERRRATDMADGRTIVALEKERDELRVKLAAAEAARDEYHAWHDAHRIAGFETVDDLQEFVKERDELRAKLARIRGIDEQQMLAGVIPYYELEQERDELRAKLVAAESDRDHFRKCVDRMHDERNAAIAARCRATSETAKARAEHAEVRGAAAEHRGGVGSGGGGYQAPGVGEPRPPAGVEISAEAARLDVSAERVQAQTCPAVDAEEPGTFTLQSNIDSDTVARAPSRRKSVAASVDPVDYGADPTGERDCSAAIAAAQAAPEDATRKGFEFTHVAGRYVLRFHASLDSAEKAGYLRGLRAALKEANESCNRFVIRGGIMQLIAEAEK